MDPKGDRLAMYQEAFVGSASRIAPHRRSLSLDQAVVIVLDEYGRREITLPDDSARMIARKLLWHPLWSILRHFRSRGEG